MKRMRRRNSLWNLVLAFALLISVSALVTAFAPTEAVAAEPYTYTIRVFAGNMGTISDGDMAVSDGLNYGTEWSFDIDTVKVTNEKYYVKGIRQSGLDNDTVSGAAFRVTQDMDFVVAYGIKGNEVAYTVSFVRDSDGAILAPSVTYYGNVDDKPVVACKYIDGYYPRYYNITGTLSDNAADNQFVFRYAPQPTTVYQTATAGNPANFVNQNNANLNNANNQNADAGIDNTVLSPSESGGGSVDTFPPQPEEILDLDAPAAAPDEGQNIPIAGILAGCFGLLALLILLLLLLIKKKKAQTEENSAEKPEIPDEPD